MQFEDLRLAEPFCRAARETGYQHPTPAQAASIPHMLAVGALISLCSAGERDDLRSIERLLQEPIRRAVGSLKLGQVRFPGPLGAIRPPGAFRDATKNRRPATGLRRERKMILSRAF
jgi:hypothetical protein